MPEYHIIKKTIILYLKVEKENAFNLINEAIIMRILNQKKIEIKRFKIINDGLDLSKFCNQIIIKTYENLADINTQIDNYKVFKQKLVEYLWFNPIVNYSHFKKSNKLYNKCNYIFEININTFKNIYYNLELV